MSEFNTQNVHQEHQELDYLTWMKRRDERVAKIAAHIASKKAEGIEQALKDAKQAVEDAEVALYLAKEQEKEVVIKAKKASSPYDFKNFDCKSFAAWAKSMSTPLENTNGRLRTF